MMTDYGKFVSEVVATALIVWYAWKWPREKG